MKMTCNPQIRDIRELGGGGALVQDSTVKEILKGSLCGANDEMMMMMNAAGDDW